MNRRASNAPLFSKCPAAAYSADDEICIHRLDEAGVFGTAVHEAGSNIVRGVEFGTQDLAARYGLDDAAKRRMLYMIGVIFRWWGRHGEAFCRDDGTLRVLDFKTTRLKDVQYDPQLREYLWLGGRCTRSGRGLITEISLEDGDISGHPDVMFVPDVLMQGQYIILFLDDETHAVSPLLSPQEIRDHHTEYVAGIEQWDRKTYCPGGHCHYCGRSSVCPERQTYLANTVRSFGLPSLDRIGAIVGRLSDAQCVQVWDPIGMAIKVLEEARSIIKLRAIAHGNTLAGDGRKLVVEEQIRHPLKALPAWPILQEYLTDAELAPAVSISKMVALGAIAAKAPRGQKGKLKEKVEAELAAADALGDDRILFPRLIPSAGASNEKMIEGS